MLTEKDGLSSSESENEKRETWENRTFPLFLISRVFSSDDRLLQLSDLLLSRLKRL